MNERGFVKLGFMAKKVGISAVFDVQTVHVLLRGKHVVVTLLRQQKMRDVL